MNNSFFKPFHSTMKSIFSNHQAMPGSPSIMESMDSLAGLNSEDLHNKNVLDIDFVSDFVSLKLGSAIQENASFLLLDSTELLKVTSAKDFLSRLGCDELTKVKVVSIFGNTGDGKSYTLNQTFFNGVEVFRTSDEQQSCTMGVWAAYDAFASVICLDTEGLLGSGTNDNQRIRMLLKVLAVSDIVVYRSRSERLHTDMISFLGSASRAYCTHFKASIEARFNGDSLSSLGPAVIVFHETRNTSPLTGEGGGTADDQLRARFAQAKVDLAGFSCLSYVGVQTSDPPTDFGPFRAAITRALSNSVIRCPRSPVHVFNTLKMLNNKFSDNLKASSPLFSDEYFSCQAKCLSCGARCSSSMGHELNDHSAPTSRCRYQEQFGNLEYQCKACYVAGRDSKVEATIAGTNDSGFAGRWLGALAKYAWAGYVIFCKHCGEIYRSRQYWYGNESPEASAVRAQIIHVWPGVENSSQGNVISCQLVLDKVSEVSEAIANVTAQPTKIIGQWAADKIAPSYWTPNDQIKVCIVCADELGTDASKHHCRACGQGVCAKCSSRSRPVPERGWNYPVRVCDKCFSPHNNDMSASEGDPNTEVTARKVGEAVVTGLSSVASILTYPKNIIKNTARPGYWVPDYDARACGVCMQEFELAPGGWRMDVHHCRDCGGAVCDGCSRGRSIVPHRGYTSPARVCDTCMAQLSPG